MWSIGRGIAVAGIRNPFEVKKKKKSLGWGVFITTKLAGGKFALHPVRCVHVGFLCSYTCVLQT